MVGSIVILAGIALLVVLGLAAVISGAVALVRINRSEGKLRGRGLAVAAIVIGLLVLLGLPAVGVMGGAAMYFVKRDEALLMKKEDQARAEKRAAEEARKRSALPPPVDKPESSESSGRGAKVPASQPTAPASRGETK